MRILNAIPFVLLAFAPVPAPAQTSPAQVEFLGGWRTDAGTQMAAFRIRLAKGWKTYWRSPGDAGIPPEIDWRGSRNIRSAQIHWPRPEVFDKDGARTIGYADEVVLPVEITVTAPGRPLLAAGALQIGVCDDVCVPVSLPFRMELSGSGASDPRIVAALGAEPMRRAGSGVSGLGCRADPIADGLRITARLPMPSGMRPDAAVFEHSDTAIWIGAAEMVGSEGRLTIAADFVPPDGKPFALDRSQIRLTLIGAASAVQIDGCPAG